MKFTSSVDGLERADLNIKIRLSRQTLKNLGLEGKKKKDVLTYLGSLLHDEICRVIEAGDDNDDDDGDVNGEFP